MAETSAPRRVDYDLTHKAAPYLDAHLVFPLLEFLEEHTTYQAGDVRKARLALVAKTNMVDYAIEIREELDNNNARLEGIPTVAEMEGRRDSVFATLDRLEKQTENLRNLLEDADQVDELKAEGKFTKAHLAEAHSVTSNDWVDYAEFAKFLYECGDYEGARDMLDHFLAINFPDGVSDTSADSDGRGFRALWGKFASEILLKNWDAAMADLLTLRSAIDERGFPPLQALQQRSWLCHWSLFVFFNHAKGHDGIIDLFLADKYLQAIQTNCPWLLRYLTCAVVINKRRRSTLKDLVRVVSQETDLSGDPTTSFLDSLYIKFDFDEAQNTLANCETALRADYFLCNCADAFMADARLFVFETYCRIHTCIDIEMLAGKLVMDRDKAERWVVDLIRGSLLDAKVDSGANTVVMGAKQPSVYDQVVDKTRDLSQRTAALLGALEAKVCAEA